MPGNSALSPDSALAADIFDHYCAAQTFKSILSHHRRLCATLNLKPGKFPVFYPKLKSKLKSWKAQGLFAKFDKRASHKSYNQGRACASTKVLVIGCGPCGIRAAIEAQLLGARVVLLEKRDRFSRNNVLHLWPMVIHDLKALGAKKFFGKFCAGAIDHISIRQLQCILLKVALLLGVEVHENVGYEELVEPSDERTGWRARLSPPDHPAADFQFDVLIGADGKRNTFKCFRRKEFRGKLAIAITANFVNRHTEAEARVDEISGVAFIFNQKFFKDLYAVTGIELENIVYYKDETHYFVMTAKKQSLLAKGVIIQDFMDTNRLLSPENVNREKLMQYAREAADFSTENRLPQLPFALNHYGREDVAMFDFTCMYASQNAGKVMERHGHKLLLQLVGDSLLEPFWPTGSGCARGFLSCFDAAWQMRSWANPRVTTLECLAERESIYRQLAQTTPRNLSCSYHGYTLDPHTRYPNLNRATVSPYQVRDLVDTDCPESLEKELALAASDADGRVLERPAKKARREPLQPDMLLKWCQKQLALTEIQVTDLTLSFKSGLALCGILHKYRPDLIDLASLSLDEPLANTQLSFSLVESELGVSPVMTAQEMADCACPDRLAMLSYLSRVYDALHGEIPYVKPKIAELLREEAAESGARRAAAGRTLPDGRRSSLSENARKQRKRKSDAAKDKTASADDPFAPAEIGPLDPAKLALVAAAFGDNYHYSSDPDGSDSDPEGAGDGEGMPPSDAAAGVRDWPGRPQLPVAALEARLAALEAAHAAEPERRQQIRQQRRQLRSLAERKAELEAALMETGASRGDSAAGPDDASLHLYRRTAATFEQRRMKLQDMVFHPGRVIQDLRKDLAAGGQKPTKKEEFATKIKDLEAKFKGQYVPPDKKPKDLSRAIGRIEKTDWNLREIERKIEDSKRVHTTREPAQPVPMWSKDMFEDKYQAMRNLSERGAVPPETLRKYADIDQHLRRLEMKLREGTTRDVGQRGSNRVSQMAQQFLDRADRAPAEKKTEAGAAEACHFCNERVYLVERMSAEGRFFHQGCFRCEYCGTVLKMMNYAFDQDSGRFFCMPHFGLHSLVKYKYQRQPDRPSDTPDKGRLSVSAAAAARGTTPERAEFENSVLVAAPEGRLSEMDEDEWTDHNFGMSAAELTSEDVLDGEDSEDDLSSSDSDEYEPALDEDEVLRLAERWRRRHSQDPLDEPSDLYESDGCDRDGDDSDTATQSETEDDASARLRRQQEVHLAEDVLKSRNRSSKHGDTSETETSSDSDSSSSEETTSSDEDATEVATDSEFDDAPAAAARPLPTIVIENSAVSETTSPEPGSPRPGQRPEPIGAEQGGADPAAAETTAPPPAPAPRRAEAISPAGKKVDRAGPAGPAARRRQGGRPRAAAEQAETIRNVNARPHAGPSRKRVVAAAETKRSTAEEEEEEDSVAKIIREARKSGPPHRPYLIQRTESSEAIAWKSSLELKRKYLTEQNAPFAPCKSQSTTDLDNRVKTFMSRISETQKLLGAKTPAAPAPRPSAALRLNLDPRVPSLSSRLGSTGTAAAPGTAGAAAAVPSVPPSASAAAASLPATPALTSPLTPTATASSARPVTAVTAPAPAVVPSASPRSSVVSPRSAPPSSLPPASPPTVPPASPPRSPAASPPPPIPEGPLPDTSDTGGSAGELDDAAAPAPAPTPAATIASAVTPGAPPVASSSSTAGSATTSSSGCGSDRPRPGADAVEPPPPPPAAPAPASQDPAGLEQAELEESLTDISAVDSQSGEARSAALAAIVEAMHSSLSEGADIQTSSSPAPAPTAAAAAPAPEAGAVPALNQTESTPVLDAVVKPEGRLPVATGTPPPPVSCQEPGPASLDATPVDFDALLGGLDVTRLEEKFEGVCSGQSPLAASSPALAGERAAQSEVEVVASDEVSVERAPTAADAVPLREEPVAPAAAPVTAAPDLAPAEDTVSAAPTSKALDVSRLIEENRTLLSQIRRRRSSSEPGSPARRAATEPEPPPAAVDSLESPGESGARDATELDLSDWAHESEVGSAAEVPHEFRVDDKFVTVRRSAVAGAERANLATLSDFEDDVSELPEDPVRAPPPAKQDVKGQFDDLDFADNSASGDEEGVGAAPHPAARNLGRCEYVFPDVAASPPSPPPAGDAPGSAEPAAEEASKPDAEHAGKSVTTAATAEIKPVTSAAPSSKPVTAAIAVSKPVAPASGASKPVANSASGASKSVTTATAAATKPAERRRSAVEALAESKSKYVKSSGYGKITAPSRPTASGDSAAAGSSQSRRASTGRVPAGSNAQKSPKENGVSGNATSSRSRPAPRGGADRTSAPTARGSVTSRPSTAGRAARPLSAGPLMMTAVTTAAPTSASNAAPKSAPVSAPNAAPAPAAVRTAAKSPAVGRSSRTSAPPAHADIRVSPFVEQASARLLLQRSPTDSVIILGQRAAAMAPRAQQGSLVRDLVLSRVKSPERQLRKRLSSPAFGLRGLPPPPPPATAPPPATPPTTRRPSTGGELPPGPPPPKPPRDPAAALSLFTPTTPPARPGALRGALSRSTPSVLERSSGMGSSAGTPAGAASPELSSSPSASRSPERGGPEGRSDPASGGHDLSKRGHPRRRSIIRAISDIFKSGEKKEKGGTSSPPPERVGSTSPPEGRRGSVSPTRPPPSPAYFAKANSVRDKLGLKFRKGKDRRSDGGGAGDQSPRNSGEVLPADLAAAHSPDASLSESLSMSQYSDAASSAGPFGRRAKTSRAARHAEMRRLQRAQELQRQLDEVEVRQRDLELRGVTVEKAIRGEGQASAGADETSLMHEWFELVHERSLLVRRDQLLQLQLRELELEDRHDRLQLELRDRMATSDSQKMAEDVERERQVVTSLLEISEQRRSLRAAMDSEQERLTSECESTEGRRAAAAALAPQVAGPTESIV